MKPENDRTQPATTPTTESVTNTCLFTGTDLLLGTRNEHTITEKIGGRIQSARVSSDAFNNSCGSTIDKALNDSYWEIMMVLGPLLARAHQPGDRMVTLEGSDDPYYVDGTGTLRPKGTKITARDPDTGRPTGAAAENHSDIMRVLEPNLPEGAQIESAFLPREKGLTKLPRCEMVSPRVELAILKSGLLTFDELLYDHPVRFTRSKALASIRESVCKIVMDGEDVPGFLGKISLGPQYEKVELFQEIRQQIDFPKTPFEHVLIASANHPTRTLDMVVWLFGVDPWGFRLSEKWEGPDFTYVAINGVLKYTNASPVFELPVGYTLCRTTDCRSAPGRRYLPQERNYQLNRMMERRMDAIRLMLYHVLLNSDDFVRKSLHNDALPTLGQSVLIERIVREALAELYEHQLDKSDLRAIFDEIVEKTMVGLPSSLREEAIEKEADLATVSWGDWIAMFRKVLTRLSKRLGYPGNQRMEMTEEPGPVI